MGHKTNLLPLAGGSSAHQQEFFIEDYRKATEGYAIEKMVFIQCDCALDQYIEEVNFITEQVQKDNRLQGIVAMAPIEKGEAVRKDLEALKKNTLVKGVRRFYGSEGRSATSADFIKGLQLLPEYDLSFDICIKYHQFKETIEMVRVCPDTIFILDHFGKPGIKSKLIEQWKKDIGVLAKLPNVYCKVSGLITEADRQDWSVADLKPYFDYVIQVFGFNKIMFGGDWPVVNLAGSYKRWIEAFYELLEDYSQKELAKLLSQNAEKVYKLN